MSKISKNIKMLDILSSGRKYTCKELSERLEVSPRMVRSYKEELEKEGFYIDSFLGKDGGYQLRSKIELPSILFNPNDIDTLDQLIKETQDKEKIQKLNTLKQKIKNYCRLVNDEDTQLEESKKGILDNMKNAIVKNTGIKIEYSSKGETKTRVIYPKQIYIYEKLIMIVAQYSEDKNDIRHLNLNRIHKIINN